MRKIQLWMSAIILSVALSACGAETESLEETDIPQEEQLEDSSDDEQQEDLTDLQDNIPDSQQEFSIVSDSPFSLTDVEPYTGEPYVVVHDNIPYFSESDLTNQSFEQYSDFDDLGRCGVAYANIGIDIMPTEDRESIGQVKPTGWHTVKYDIVDGKYLYNRCHLIGFQLAGENANEKNLITGTRYMNVDGMLPFENMVADYVKETENHVLYRVTPIFESENLVASGVLMEAESVEDRGEDIQFCVYAYNVQPGVIIDYATGESQMDGSEQEVISDSEVLSEEESQTQAEEPVTDAEVVKESESQGTTYILNTNTKKFHYPSCSSVGQMKESNKQEFTGIRDDVILQGYDPCKRCNP